MLIGRSDVPLHVQQQNKMPFLGLYSVFHVVALFLFYFSLEFKSSLTKQY